MPQEWGWPVAERNRYLGDTDAIADETERLHFQGRDDVFTIKLVPIGLPKYRLSNGRTATRQSQYISTKDLDSDFFEADWEREEAQTAQHSILLELIHGKGLEARFTKAGTRQTEPLILTSDGFVANGNRRLCAMRKCYYNNRIAYEHYSHVKVVQLPTATERDIVRLEAELQIEEDKKKTF